MDQHLTTFYQTLLAEGDPLVGQSKKQAIWKKNKATLYRYESTSKKKYHVPILIVYALINKPYILDLSPDDSFIQALIKKGHDVFLLDWGTPGLEDKGMTFEHYLTYIQKSCKEVLRASQASELTLLGYCMGGVLTSLFTSLHPNVPVKNMILLTTPFDFSKSNLFSLWLDDAHFKLDQTVDTLGLIPASLIDFGSKLLTPYDSFIGVYQNLYDRIQHEQPTEKWKLMQKWVNDGVPFPGEAFRQWIRDFYQENKLLHNQLTLGGKSVRLDAIHANLLVIAGEHDHIVSPDQVEPAMTMFSSKDKTFLTVPTGHISVVIGNKAKKHTIPAVLKWLDKRSV